MTNALAKNYNIGSLIVFALPNMIMMLFLSMYTIVDGMFISRFVGTNALSATNMVYPAISAQMAVSIMIASGGSAIIATRLGEGRQNEAKSALSLLVASEIVLGILTALFGYVFIDQIVTFLGASSTQKEMCIEYMAILFLFAPAFYLQTAFQVFFVTAGRPGLGLGVTAAAGISNIVLDYLFMSPFNMGIAGAAIATGIGYSVVAVWGLVFFAVGKNNPIRFSKPKLDICVLIKSFSNGSSEMVTNLSNSVTTFLFNYSFLKYYGEDGVASITIVLYFQFILTAIFFGYSNGIAPVISYKYGSGDKPQLKTIFKSSILFVVLGSFVTFVLSRLSISLVLDIFTGHGASSVKNVTLDGFGIYSFSFLLMGTSIFASSMFTAFSDGFVSAVISFARTFLFLTGTIIILPYFLDSAGLWLSVPAAEVLGIIISVWFFISKEAKYGY